MRARLIAIILFCIISWHVTKNRAIAYFLKNAIKNQNGLTGFYYQNTERFGSPSLIRIDPSISLDFQKDYFIGSETESFKTNKIKGDSQGEKDFSPCAQDVPTVSREGGQRSAPIYRGGGEPWVPPIDYFSANWVGLIYIENRGRYTFGTASDDGSWLYIDHKKIVDNGGIHPKKKVSGRIYLKKGYHSLELSYNEINGNACIELYWRKPGGVKEVIPPKFLMPVSKDFDINKTDTLYINMIRVDLIFICLLFLLSYLAHI